MNRPPQSLTATPSSQAEPSTAVTVLLVDDHPLVRDGVAHLLRDGGFDVIGEAASFAEGSRMVQVLTADVVVVDVSLGDGSGLELVAQVRAAGPTTGIVVLTMHDDDETLLGALEAGASSLVLKTSSSDEVLTMVGRAATAPGSFTAPGLADALRRRSDTVRPRLTDREQEVLVRLAAGDSVSGMAKRLYMSESTVKTHIAKLYAKLEANNRASAVMAAVRLGFVHS